MKAVMHFAKVGDFKLTVQLKECVSVVFTNLLNSKMNEDVNQKLRDAEERTNASKEVRHIEQWARCIDSGVLERYDRPQVVTSCVLPAMVPRGSKLEEVFHPVYDDKTSEALPFKKILLAQDWPTFNSQSLKKAFGDAQLLLHMKATNTWELCDAYWKARLLPEKVW